jgi:tRNA-2-methylthio-N6-dimethylallyladenosine synthase
MTPKVFIKTFGCQMNEYDSDKMADVLHAAQGYEPTANVEEADLILFNTCSVREKAQEKVFSDLGRVKHLKARGVKIGVGGCVASQEGAAIIARAPYVDVVFGPQTLHRLPEMLHQREREGRPQVDISFPEIEKFDHLPPARVEGVTAFVSIMEGCSKYCSYCVVPYTRGEEVNRPIDDVLVEIAGLADQGVREVTLLGQNVNAYRGRHGRHGRDRRLRAPASSTSPTSRASSASATPPATPTSSRQRLIDAYGPRAPSSSNHLHLPVQHGSDRILMAMKRGYTAMEYKSTVRKLRAIRPGLALSSDFIVGFPGETDADFDKMMKLIDRSSSFDTSFSFIFSPRPGTPAAATSPDDTPHPVKLAAPAAAAGRDRRTTCKPHWRQPRRHRAARPGRRAPRARSAHELMGRTECNRVVNFDGGPQAARLVGRMVDVRITRSLAYTLRGEIPTAESPQASAREAAVPAA